MIKRILCAFLALFADKSAVWAEDHENSAETTSKWKLPDQLRLGPVDFQPRLTAGMTYDDNILIASHNAESDVIWSVQPAFLAVAGDRLAIAEYRKTYTQVIGFNPDTFIVTDPVLWPGPTVLLDYGPRFNQFTKHTENNSIDQLESLTFLWPMSKLILGLRQDYRMENTTVIEANQRSVVETINAELLSGYQFSEKTSAEANLRLNSIGYEVKSLNGYKDWSNDDWFNYQLDPLLNLGAGVRVGIFDVENQGKQTYQQFLSRARYTFTERSGLDASAGVDFRQFETVQSESIEPVFNLSAYYRPRDQTTLNLIAYRREQPSVYVGANYVVTGVGGHIRQQIGDRYFVNFGIDYFAIDYLATVQSGLGNRTDDYFVGSIGLEIRFSKHWVGNVVYQYRSVTSNQYDGFKNNQTGIQLTWTY